MVNLRFSKEGLKPVIIDLATTLLKKGDIIKLNEENLMEHEEPNFHVVMEAVYGGHRPYVYLTEICQYNINAAFPAQNQIDIHMIKPILYGNCLNQPAT